MQHLQISQAIILQNLTWRCGKSAAQNVVFFIPFNDRLSSLKDTKLTKDSAEQQEVTPVRGTKY